MPLAIEFSKLSKCLRTNNKLERKITGFDINLTRINELKRGYDRNKEHDSSVFNNNKKLKLKNNIDELYDSEVFIITVPTPVDDAKKPDYSFTNATEIVANAKKKNKLTSCVEPIVIYESKFIQVQQKNSVFQYLKKLQKSN